MNEIKINIHLGPRLRVLGRTREAVSFPGGKPNSIFKNQSAHEHAQKYDWFSEIKSILDTHRATVTYEEVETHRHKPSGTSSKIKDGVFGGTEVQYLDVLCATFAAAGGVKGLREIVALIKEIKSVAPDRTIEIIIKEKYKIKVKTKEDLNYAIKKIKELDDSAV